MQRECVDASRRSIVLLGLLYIKYGDYSSPGVSLFTGLDYWTDLFAIKNQFYALLLFPVVLYTA